MTEVKFYMLVEGEDSLYLALYDSEKNLISSYSNLNQNDINNYIENLENEKEFFISWEEEKSSDYLKLDEKLISYLLGKDNFVNDDFEIIEKKEVENLALFIRNNKEIEDRLDIYIEINDNLLTKNNIVGNYIYSQGIFYKVDIEEDTQFPLLDLFQKIDKYELESYATLILKNYKNIDLKYEDYETVLSEERNAIPQIIIEKISFDNSLYIKINSIISTMDYEFFTKNKIETVLIVNELEKKLEISKINLENLSSDMFEIVKVLTKLQKTIGLKSSYYIDNENFIILNEELAKEFVKKELLQLTGKYSIIGTDRLRKYNIKAVRPKLSGKFSYNLDYFEGEVEVEIEGEKFSIQQLLNNYKKDEYIILSDGTNALINREYIEKLQRVFKEEDGNKIKVSFFDMPIVQDMIDEKAFENDFMGSKDFFEGINELPKEEVEYPKLNATLRDYQKYGYKWLKYLTDNNLGACLADDMGLGKTLQAIALLSNLHEEKKKKSMVIMPKSLIYNWENEIKKFAPKLKVGVYYGINRDFSSLKKVDVILTTYGTIRNDIENLLEHKFDLLILDESQNIKNINSQTTKAVLLLNAKKRVALSGTPIENNLLELYSLFRFLNPEMFGSVQRFTNSYILPIQKYSDTSTIEELKKKIYPFLLRRVKKEVLEDLPDKIEKLVYVDMNDEHRRFYEERRKYYYSLLEKNTSSQGNFDKFFVLQAINELRHIVSSPELETKKIISSKKEVLIENVIEAIENNHKVLVFVNYLSSIESICDSLKENKIKYLKMTGQTKDRQNLVDKFQNDSRYKVFVMTLKTGGVGLNLVSADTIFIYDPWWNTTVENQAIDRAYRLGQDKTVFAYKMIMRNTIEEKILKLQEIKNKLLDDLISEDNLSTKNLSKNDIEFILGS
ncbi:Hef nuclease [Fusobacterium polymorphum]|uniref:Snf2 family helicase n=1 Tax=Fusobacterium polymorphum ATCC 10953 TaxID=393480 RepID=A5TY42_FUSNP|nr:DEAD/DEAH box helicase [Fusobacterium polymorphum]EDK89817.1 Snf2 family helicase [Fusobacterium polymorphum ATCC 10953]UTI52728.1 DEAD/DEAH box helicase [Fusobacterium polymorphum]WRL69472.1 DEAD/DEAH box helicase [Fusobacterium polymorphum]CKH11793.1 Hef nuclease [Fusobacterium polymorphum]